MKENSPDFSQKDLVDLQKSPVGQQLYEKLRSADPATLEKAMEEAQRAKLLAGWHKAVSRSRNWAE